MNLVKISDLFEVKYGVNLELINLNEAPKRAEDTVCFVSRTENNNGVSAFVEKTSEIRPISAGTLTVAGGGSVLATFLQPYEYYSGRDLFYLTPKKKMTEREMVYYSICIKRNKYRYSYNRQANKTLKNLFVPTKVPDEFLKQKISELNTKSTSDKKFPLLNRKWEWFSLDNLFTFEKGERLTKAERMAGDTPLVTAGENHNGVSESISLEDFKVSKKVFEDKITIDMFFNVFYHGYKYFSDDNIHTLIPINFELNKYSSLFVVTILSKLKYKYAYGRQVRLMRLPLEKIKLPITMNGNPDWQFMENYIKSLPYSAAL